MGNNFLLKIAFFTFIIMVLWSCTASYSFTGASISPEVKTVSIDFFPNQASLAPPSVGQEFTEALKDIFLSQTNLTLVNSGGDLTFEGYISNYTANPVAIQGDETAALTRVTMTVKVIFTDNNDEKNSFESNFSSYEDFETSKSLSAVEEELIQSINEKLVQDIFNKSVTNW